MGPPSPNRDSGYLSLVRTAALKQAEARAAKARQALLELTAGKSYQRFVEAWSDFLLAHNGAFSKLEAGARGCGKSEAWFGRKKHERKTDELLRYLHQARNIDEHGLEPTTMQHSEVQFSGSDFPLLGVWADGPITSVTAPADVGIEHTSWAVLVPVTDPRFGDSFAVPTMHLGAPVPEATPAKVAEIGLSYLDRLLAEAAKQPERP